MISALSNIKTTLKPFYKWLRQPLLISRHDINYHRAKRKILIDCGANSGKVLEEFILQKKGFEFFAFEPQPELFDTGKKLQEKYSDVHIQFYNRAVWIKNTQMNFYLATKWGPNYKGASTLVNGHTKNGGGVDYSRPVEVDAIDFSEWIINSFKQDDYLIIKMDIEGAEYEVLEKMIETGSINYLNELIIEFHQNMNENISLERHVALLKYLKSKVKLTEWH